MARLLRQPMSPTASDLAKNIRHIRQWLADAPARIVRLHLSQVAVIADVVADAILIQVAPLHRLSAGALGQAKGFEDRAGVALSAAQVVHLGHARCFGELEHEPRDVLGVNVVADLLPFISVNLVLAAFEIALISVNLLLAAFEIALDEVTEEAVQLDAGVVGPGEASASQAARGHIEVAPVLLHHDIAAWS